MSKEFRIGSRASELAVAQANLVSAAIRAGGQSTATILFQTRGDRILDRALDQVGGQGIFTTELEDALLAGEIDCAVHSLKDLPTELMSGLVIGAYSEREDVRDAMVSLEPGAGLSEVPNGASVGTSSIRRRAFLQALRPDLQVVPVRGNLTTRVSKMESSGWYGLILAAAGVHRLGWQSRVGFYLDPEVFVPAPGQGVLALEIRAGDVHSREIVGLVNYPASEAAARAERAVLGAVGGGCQVPLGAWARWVDAKRIRLVGKIANMEGRSMMATVEGLADHAERLGRELAHRLLEEGGRELLDSSLGK